MSGSAQPKRPGADVDAWVWQSQTLDDLAAFVREHGPRSASPLPVLNWHIGAFRSIGADLPTFEPDADRLATLDAYANAFGAVVSRRTAKDRTVYTVRGRIGRPEGTDRRPRVSVIIQATVWRELDAEPADSLAAAEQVADVTHYAHAMTGEGADIPRCGAAGHVALFAYDVTCPSCLALLAEPCGGAPC